jgi:hypothetical protein
VGCYVVAYTLRYRVILTADSIELHGAMTQRRLRRADIQGRRVLRTNNAPPTIILAPKDKNSKALKLSQVMPTDDDFRDWLASVPDLDAADMQHYENEVAANLDYGMTPADRIALLGRARTVAKIVSGASFGLSIWVWIYPHPYELAIATVALVPLIALGLIHQSKGLYSFNQKARSGKPDISAAIFMPSLVLGMRAFIDIHIVDWHQGLTWAAAGGTALVLMTAAVVEPVRRRPASMLALCLFWIPYAYGAMMESDELFDRSAQQQFRVEVLNKHVTHGKTTLWELGLAPWGPRIEAKDVQVSRNFYESTPIGMVVCVNLHDGAVGIPWFAITHCNDNG